MGSKLHTHYDNLKVARNAPDFVIRAAYKALSQQYHPDKHGGDPAAGNAMRLINEAYAELSDPARRAAHDAWIAQREAQARAQTQQERPQQQAQQRPPPPRRSRIGQRSRKRPQPPPQTSSQSDLWQYGGAMLILFLVVLLIGRSGPNRNTTSSSIDATPSSSVASPRPAQRLRLLLTWQPRLLHKLPLFVKTYPRPRLCAGVKRSRGRCAQLRSCGAATLPRHRHYRRPSEQRLAARFTQRRIWIREWDLHPAGRRRGNASAPLR